MLADPPVAGGKTITEHGNAMLPLYRHGDRLIVSDKVPIAVGDRVLVEARGQGTLGGTLLALTSRSVAVMLGGRLHREVLVESSEVEFLGRIVWASQ